MAIPLALIAFADVTVVERELPEFLGNSMGAVVASPESRSELVDDLGSTWLDEHPRGRSRLEAAGLEPEATVAATFDELATSDAFVAELERSAIQYGQDLVAGEPATISLDFSVAIADSDLELHPVVKSIIQQSPTVETMPFVAEETTKFREWTSQVKQVSLFAAAIASLLLALLTLSVRHHIASLFFMGMPVLFLQRFILNEAADDPDPVDAAVGAIIAETWLPWTHIMMAISFGALVLLVVIYHFFPLGEATTVPYAKDAKKLPPQAVISSVPGEPGYFWDTEEDYADLRELSIVED